LRSQPRNPAAHRLTLGHWRSRNGGVCASLVKHALGEFTGPGPILMSTGDDVIGSGICASRGQ
jgi:hypothetical protein